MFRKSHIPAIFISVLLPSPLWATDWNYTPQGAESTELTGGLGAVGDPSSGTLYNDGQNETYAVILDSGSSGFLMSKTVTDDFSIPLQNGQTYLETGIGGSEVENVTTPLVAYYEPASGPATLTAYGTYTFESRQDDPFEEIIYFDVVGTPILQNTVMVVTPGQYRNLVQDTLGFLTAKTVLQPTAPALPSKGLYHVPVTWTNFVTGTPVPTEGLNPVVHGVTARGPNGIPDAQSWLFDSGAQFTIIDPTYASNTLGIDLKNPIATVDGQGVGGSDVTFDEFQLTDLALPLSNGDRLVFQNPYVFVPEDQSLPAGLMGILGENLFMQSTDMIDPLSGQPEGTYAPLFSQWYLDGPGSQLVLYDPNSTYGAVTPGWTGTTNNNWTTLATDVNWAGGSPWFNNADRTMPNTAVFNLATPATITVNGNIDVGSITFTTGGWTLAAGAGKLAFGATGTMNIISTTGANTIAAVIADGAGFGTGGGVTSLAITGPGTLILAGPNSYSGGTTLASGILLVNNISGSGTGSGNVVVNGGTLGGSGTIAGTVLPGAGVYRIHPGEGLSPTSTATLSVGALSANYNTTLDFNLVTPGVAGGSDLLKVTSAGGLTINGAVLAFTNHATGAGSLGYYKLIQYTGAIQGQGLATMILPLTVNHVVYLLSTTRDPGFLDVHRGLSGDANDDGVVNFADFVLLSNNFGKPNAGWNGADFNNDGVTNFADFTILSNDFGATIGTSEISTAAGEPTGVPEPGSLLLVGAGLLGLFGRRRPPPRARKTANVGDPPVARHQGFSCGGPRVEACFPAPNHVV